MIVPISSNKMMIFAQAKDTSNSFSYPILISTRDHFDNYTGDLKPNHTTTDYIAMNIPGLETDQCPKELVVFVHGAWVVKMSIKPQ